MIEAGREKREENQYMMQSWERFSSHSEREGEALTAFAGGGGDVSPSY